MQDQFNELREIFEHHQGNLMDKWAHYFDIYHRHFAHLRNRPITLLEIGVFHGGSLQMWRKYFGEQGQIIGVDIDPRCKQFESDGVQVFIGDQADPVFLRSILEQYPQLDIVIDDGGHQMHQLRASFEVLFPALKLGGIYVAEDLHTCYSAGYGGGLGKPESFIEYSKRLLDFVNYRWIPADQLSLPQSLAGLYSVHAYDSVLVVEKRLAEVYRQVAGKPVFEMSAEYWQSVENQGEDAARAGVEVILSGLHTHFTTGSYKLAAAEAKKLVSLGMANENVWVVLGICEAQLGDVERACESIHQAILLAPDNDTYKELYGSIAGEPFKPATPEQDEASRLPERNAVWEAETAGVRCSSASEYQAIPEDAGSQVSDIAALIDFLASRSQIATVIDVGCRVAELLSGLNRPYDYWAIGSEAETAAARRVIPAANCLLHDLSQGMPPVPADILSNAIVVCSGTLASLESAANAVKGLAGYASLAPFVLVTTPDSDRVADWIGGTEQANLLNGGIWNGPELLGNLQAAGFKHIPFYGHIMGSAVTPLKTSLLALTGAHAVYAPAPAVKVAAVIHTFNERDIIEETVNHLSRQGVEIHCFDNWSKDGTWEVLNELHERGIIAHCERFPHEPTDFYEWSLQLKKTTEYAQTIDAEWILHHDADEIRVSPWQGISLRDAISFVDRLGYNAVDFTVVDFRFLKSQTDIEGDYERRLNYFEFGRRSGHFIQVKAWKNRAGVNLATSGGHEAIFNGRKIYPIKFLLKHYSLRNTDQAKSKVFQHRLPRFEKEKSSHGWHTQYDQFIARPEFDGWSKAGLIPWQENYFLSEFVVERISGIGLAE